MDKDRLQALFLAEEAFFILMKKTGGVRSMLKPLPGEWEEMSKLSDELGSKLKKSGEYFYPGGGSVFSEFKELRDAAGDLTPIVNKFRKDMNVDEIISVAEGVLEEWKSSGKERKG